MGLINFESHLGNKICFELQEALRNNSISETGLAFILITNFKILIKLLPLHLQAYLSHKMVEIFEDVLNENK